MENKVRKLLQPLFDNLGYHLVDLSLRGNPNNRVLSVFADTEEGITMQQITELSREIEDILDMDDPIPGRYRLEISSPGTNYPLKEDWQFRKNIGRTLKVVCEEEGKRQSFSGVLLQFDADKIELELPDRKVDLPRAQIVRATVKPSL